jgi:2-polyprenyl-3-methyl-5-hydroxy-6-metoxy-1,4-benzoquinol methylase
VDVKEQDILGDQLDNHWYYAAKSAALLQLLNGYTASEVLDVGAGSGFFSRKLLEAGVCDSATCVDTGYATEWRTLQGTKPIAYVRSVPEVHQKLVLMMDVIEHVDDDVALMRSYTDRMPAGALLVVTVPAFQFLWSGHDVFLEHRRRYTLEGLQRSVTRAGMKVQSARYFFSALFPAICRIRLIQRLRLSTGQIQPHSDLRRHSPLANSLLKGIHAVERQTLFRINKLAGLSAFCLARKM